MTMDSLDAPTVWATSGAQYPEMFSIIRANRSPWMDTATAPGTAPNYEVWAP